MAAQQPKEQQLDALQHPYATHVNPYLASQLASAGLDSQFVLGEGTRLRNRLGAECTDFVAAFGAVPVGHNNPAAWQVCVAFGVVWVSVAMACLE